MVFNLFIMLLDLNRIWKQKFLIKEQICIYLISNFNHFFYEMEKQWAVFTSFWIVTRALTLEKVLKHEADGLKVFEMITYFLLS